MLHALHRQQELLVVVAARLARDQALRRAVPRSGDPAARHVQPGQPRVLAHGARAGAARRRRCTCGIRWPSANTWPSGIPACGRPIPSRAPGRARSPREMHSGFARAAQRHDDVHPRAARRAARGRTRSPPTSRASRRSGARVAAPLRHRAGRTCAARSRSPTCSTHRSPFASRPTTCSPRAPPGDYLAALLGASVPARMGGAPRWRRRKSSRPTSRASSIATSCRPRAAR